MYAKAKMQANDTIVIGFTILANEQLRKEQDSHLHEALQAYKMQLKWETSRMKSLNNCLTTQIWQNQRREQSLAAVGRCTEELNQPDLQSQWIAL